jgi:tRNA pseudouridine38-40 synthase
MKKFAICFAYLPSINFMGFSNQLHDPNNIFTVINEALKRARLYGSKNESKISFASRTDRGVGALHQVIAIITNRTPILPEINSYLPESIKAIAQTEVSPDFHPRRDAKLRTYSYFLTSIERLDITLARETLSILKGKHDFRNFAKIESTKEKNTVKEIKTAKIFPINNETYQIRIASQSFLWQQVRRIIGHLIEVSTGIYSSKQTNHLLEPKLDIRKPPAASPLYLILENIQYEKVQFQYDQKSLNSFRKIIMKQSMHARAHNALYSFITDLLTDIENEGG